MLPTGWARLETDDNLGRIPPYPAPGISEKTQSRCPMLPLSRVRTLLKGMSKHLIYCSWSPAGFRQGGLWRNNVNLQRFTLCGSPPADEATREQIALRQFLWDLPACNVGWYAGAYQPSRSPDTHQMILEHSLWRPSSGLPTAVAPAIESPNSDRKLATLERRMAAAINAKIGELVERLGILQVGGGRGANFEFHCSGGRGCGHIRGSGHGSLQTGDSYNCGESRHKKMNCTHLQYPPQEN